jgi:hypothetical protein
VASILFGPSVENHRSRRRTRRKDNSNRLGGNWCFPCVHKLSVDRHRTILGLIHFVITIQQLAHFVLGYSISPVGVESPRVGTGRSRSGREQCAHPFRHRGERIRESTTSTYCARSNSSTSNLPHSSFFASSSFFSVVLLLGLSSSPPFCSEDLEEADHSSSHLKYGNTLYYRYARRLYFRASALRVCPRKSRA